MYTMLPKIIAHNGTAEEFIAEVKAGNPTHI